MPPQVGPFRSRPARRAGLLCALLLAACGRDAGTVRIAAVGNWDGPDEQVLQRGIEQALGELNGAGGPRYEIVYHDDNDTDSTAARIATELVADPSIVAVIGHTRSDPTLVAMRAYSGHVPVVSARMTSPDISGISSWVFSLLPTDSAYSAAVARFADDHGWTRGAVVFNNTAKGRAAAESFRAQFHGQVLSQDPAVFPAPLPGDLTHYVAYHKQRGLDVVYVPVGEPKEYIREAQAQALPAAVIGWDVWAPLTYDPALPGEFYHVLPFDLRADRAETRAFVDAYARAHGGEAAGIFAASGYDALKVLAHAIDEGGADREAIRDALAALNPEHPYAAVIGPLSFAADGTPVGPQPVVVPLTAARGGAR